MVPLAGKDSRFETRPPNCSGARLRARRRGRENLGSGAVVVAKRTIALPDSGIRVRQVRLGRTHGHVICRRARQGERSPEACLSQRPTFSAVITSFVSSPQKANARRNAGLLVVPFARAHDAIPRGRRTAHASGPARLRGARGAPDLSIALFIDRASCMAPRTSRQLKLETRPAGVPLLPVLISSVPAVRTGHFGTAPNLTRKNK